MIRRWLPKCLRDGYLWLTALLSIFSIGPLMQPGYFWGAHDARHSVYFLFEFNRAIQDGIWYPRWAPDFTFGYGYPFFNIYGPLAFYAGEFFHLLGFDFVDSTKIVFALSLMLSGMTMFLFARRLMGPQAALVAGLMYVYVPYHLADVYVRAALSESFGLIFVPLLLWGVYETIRAPRLNAVIGAGFAFAATMMSTQLLTMLSLPLLAAFTLLLVLERVLNEQPWRALSRQSWPALVAHVAHVAFAPALGLCLGTALSAIFWLPMVTEYKYVRIDQWAGGYYDYRDHFIHFFQLFSPKWGFGTSQPGPHDATPFQLGAVPVTLAILALLFRRRIASATVRRLTLFFVAFTVLIVFLMLSPSTPVWDALRLVSFAQFPWRLLVVVIVALAFVAGSVVAADEDAPPDPAATKKPAGHCERSEAISGLGLEIASSPCGRLAMTPDSVSPPMSGAPTRCGGAQKPRPGVIALVLLILIGSYPYLQAQIVEPAEGPVGLAGLMRFQQSANEMTGSTAWVQEIPRWSAIADHYIAGKEVASKIDFTASQETLEAVPIEVGTNYELVRYKTFTEPARLVFDIFYYPGWRAYSMKKDDAGYSIDRELKIEPYGKLGKISVQVDPKRRHVLVRFEDTPVRIAGKIISAFGLLAVIAFLLGRRAIRIFGLWRARKPCHTRTTR